MQPSPFGLKLPSLNLPLETAQVGRCCGQRLAGLQPALCLLADVSRSRQDGLLANTSGLGREPHTSPAFAGSPTCCTISRIGAWPP